MADAAQHPPLASNSPVTRLAKSDGSELGGREKEFAEGLNGLAEFDTGSNQQHNNSSASVSEASSPIRPAPIPSPLGASQADSKGDVSLPPKGPLESQRMQYEMSGPPENESRENAAPGPQELPLDKAEAMDSSGASTNIDETTESSASAAAAAAAAAISLATFQSQAAQTSGDGPTTPQQPISVAVTAVEGIYLANYSGVDVLEYEVDHVCVMRRISDSALNATQILKLAGLDKSKRTRVLERELKGKVEKVQGGYRKYQGSWVSFEVGLMLCKQYSVADSLAPLLKFDMSQANIQRTPTREQAYAARMTHIPTHQMPVASHVLRTSPLSSRALAALSSLTQSPRKRLKLDGTETGGTETANIPMDPSTIHLYQQPLPPLQQCPETDRSRDMITEMFLNLSEDDSFSDVPDNQGIQIEIDAPIDDAGHTALHWAAALGRIQLVRSLIERGADCRRSNYSGESPLVRAVLVTNNSDLSSFKDLLNYIYPAIYLIDTSGRTVLHHIALTAGIRGRADASRYYLETLLSWVVCNKNLETFAANLLNVQDSNGDTALNIAARVGNKSIVHQLLEVNADANIANRAGLRPADFEVVPPFSRHVDQTGAAAATAVATAAAAGASTPEHVVRPRSSLDTTNVASDEMVSQQTEATGPISGPTPVPSSSEGAIAESSKGQNLESRPKMTLSGVEKRKEILEMMKATLATLEQNFSQEVELKQNLLNELHAQLRETAGQLSIYRQHVESLRDIVSRFSTWRRSVESLESAMQAEDSNFHAGSNHSMDQIVHFEGNFDADQPFRIDANSEDLANGRIPVPLLRARLSAYKYNEQRLIKLRDELKGRSTMLEQKFRHVVSLCTGVFEDQVDSLLESLLQAVESDAGDVDMSRVASFLEKVGKQEQSCHT